MIPSGFSLFHNVRHPQLNLVISIDNLIVLGSGGKICGGDFDLGPIPSKDNNFIDRRYRLSSLAQESSVNIRPTHTVSTPPEEYKYEVGTKSVIGILI